MFFFFQAEDGIRDVAVTGVQTCALPISCRAGRLRRKVQRAASDRRGCVQQDGAGAGRPGTGSGRAGGDEGGRPAVTRDRKSTRLNSSHGYISYAVFCLKKKNQ